MPELKYNDLRHVSIDPCDSHWRVVCGKSKIKIILTGEQVIIFMPINIQYSQRNVTWLMHIYQCFLLLLFSFHDNP